MQLNFFQTLKQKSKKRQQNSLSEGRDWLNTLNIDILRRPFQRSLSVRVRPNGLVRVTCSKTCKVEEIHRFLLSHKTWVEKSQKQFELTRQKYPQKQFVPGEEYLFRGHLAPLVMERIKSIKKPKFYFLDNQLVFTHDLERYTREELKNWLREAYKKEGKIVLGQLVRRVGSEMNLHPSALSFRSQKTRWGSCSSEGKISLNWRLVVAPLEVARYVVVHEIAHLQHQDHSSQFWGLVAEYCPDYKDHKKWLEQHQYEMDFLAKKSELYL